MMKVSDYVAQRLVEHGVRDVFMVTGGGAMHLNMSFGTHPGLRCLFNHHEQACSMAADSYCRLSNCLPLVNVTTGPGGTNAITGVHGAWTDSIAMLVISGQVKWETTVRSTGLPLRQLGDQEIDIIENVRSITKYAEMVTDPQSIRYHLEKALHLATTGRPGPCWLDIPGNVQAAKIDPDQLKGFDPAELEEPWKQTDVSAAVGSILAQVAQSKRPVVLAGAGVRISRTHLAFLQAVERMGIPVVTGWNAHDVIWDDHPLYVGRPGSLGDRSGNFAVQNADLLLVLGSRLNVRQVGWNFESFARHAHMIMVDIDELEMQKPTLHPSQTIHTDLADLLPQLAIADHAGPTEAHRQWLAWCRVRRAKYPVVLPEYRTSARINPYHFVETLFQYLEEDQVVVTANGAACVVTFQAAHLKRGQRLFTNSGCAAMGFDLPAAIGACRALGDQPVVCIAGDGSIMMNLQELQTIRSNQLPIKIFILNNDGYISIKQSQTNFFGKEVGAGPASGVALPDFGRIAQGFGLPYFRCSEPPAMQDTIQQVLATDGPVVCEILLDPEKVFAPKLSSKQLPDGRMVSCPLEDLAPFLSREELRDNMLVPLWDPSEG